MPLIAPRVRPRLLACAAVLLSLSAPALAQRTVEGDLQQQMSPAEFQAAGLDKLSAAELASLNRWLQGKVQAATTQAVATAREEGRQEVIKKNRGFFDFGSDEPIETSVTRGVIELEPVTYEVKDGKIGVITINEFSRDVGADVFAAWNDIQREAGGRIDARVRLPGQFIASRSPGQKLVDVDSLERGGQQTDCGGFAGATAHPIPHWESFQPAMVHCDFVQLAAFAGYGTGVFGKIQPLTLKRCLCLQHSVASFLRSS